jgi:hypothetical protein
VFFLNARAPAMTVTAASSASPREQAVMSTASGADVDEIKREITEIYSIHNPQKLGQLGALWQKYAGREAQMLAGVRNKYGVSDGGRSGHSVTRREIERLYTEYEPAKLNDVASLCLEHGEGALLKQVREQYAAATPESTPRHVEQLDEDERRRYGGVVLTEEREDSCTVFKMQMAVVGGTKTGFMTENAPLTAAEPRFEVTVVTDESGRIEHDEQVLAQMSEIGACDSSCPLGQVFPALSVAENARQLARDAARRMTHTVAAAAAAAERKRHAEKMLKMWRTEEELKDTSDISYAQQEKFPADIRVGLTASSFDFADARTGLGRSSHSVCYEAGGLARSRTPGRAECAAAPRTSAGDVIGVEALFDKDGKYTGFVAFDVNGGEPVRIAYTLTAEEQANGGGALNPAVSVGRGDRLRMQRIRHATPAVSPVVNPPPGTFLPLHASSSEQAAAAAEPDEDLSVPSYVCSHASKEVSMVQMEPHDLLVCPDQSEWLQSNMRRYGYGSISAIISILVHFCNREAKQRKSVIFRNPRCRRCTAATTGGKKTLVRLGLSAEHWQWMSSISAKCGHASVDKTLRILLDWYKLYATANNPHLGEEIWGCSDWDTYFREGGAEGGEAAACAEAGAQAYGQDA